MADRLAAGQAFPNTVVALSDGSSMSLPGDMGHGWKMILFFRGIW